MPAPPDNADASPEAHEERLLKQAVAGDEAALEELLVSRHAALLLHVERQMSGAVQARVSPEDIAQQAYLQVFKSIGAFQPRGVGAFYAWLKTVASRKLIDAVRSRGREQLAARPAAVGNSQGASAAASLMGMLAASDAGPGGEAMIEELRSAFQVALANLPDNYREVVQLRYLEDLPLEEVAQRLGITPGAARGLCHRSRQALRDEILRLSRYI